MLDYHVILDLLPTLAGLVFQRRLVKPSSDGAQVDGINLNALQSAILLGLGLQQKTVETVEVNMFFDLLLYFADKTVG